MRGFVLGKIAADLDQALARREASGAPGRTTGRLVAGGNGWSVEDVLCTCGPGDRPFEERHTAMSIGVVVRGTFQYRSPLGRDLMTPGSFLLGNAGQCFECGHEHAAGDRCVALRYAPDYFDRLAADAGAPSGERRFRASRLPPVRALSAWSLVLQRGSWVPSMCRGRSSPFKWRPRRFVSRATSSVTASSHRRAALLA